MYSIAFRCSQILNFRSCLNKVNAQHISAAVISKRHVSLRYASITVINILMCPIIVIHGIQNPQS